MDTNREMRSILGDTQGSMIRLKMKDSVDTAVLVRSHFTGGDVG